MNKKFLDVPAWPKSTMLNIKAKDVDIIDQEIIELAEKMIATMQKNVGIGLAAVQICEDKNMFVLNVPRRSFNFKTFRKDGYLYYVKEATTLINPEIIAKSDKMSEMEEGCLSLPGILVKVKRPQFITVKYLDLNGKEQKIHAGGLLATCIQHEIDHLHGKIILDYASEQERKILEEKLINEIST